MRRTVGALVLVLGLVAACVAMAQVEEKKQVVIISGEQGAGIHDCAGVNELFADMLNESGLPIEARHYVSWPEDWSEAEDADAVVFYCNGGPLHPLGERPKELRAMMARGAGVLCMHQAVGFVEGPAMDLASDWLGGHYEAGYSTNPFWVADVTPNKDHPVCNGVRPFAVEDEWYFHLRFHPGEDAVVPLLVSAPTEEKVTESRRGTEHWNEPSAKAFGTPQILMWAREGENGARGAGITAGHFRHNFKNDDLRKVVLNAMAWIAKVEVPADGVPSKTPDYVELR